ncbi:MAG TPA: phage Gp37/Gp68 family protein [Desulfatiglandales bacterium]|nr:phage Gp37/Gp68 family protein [Desulfatiglandales bacterium]
MSTKIEWAEETWNPITGCTPISEGCAHCYARRMAQRLKGRYGYPADDPFKVTTHLDRLYQPLHWHKPKHIFTVSMGDLFHPDVSDMVQGDILSVIEHCKWHTFLVLTKRPLEMQKVIKWAFADILPDNLWLGVTAENQQRADERIPILLQIPAAKHFISIEPMLGPVDLHPFLPRFSYCPAHDYGDPGYPPSECSYCQKVPGLDWIIAGCESGPNRRETKTQWLRDLKNECVEANVSFFLKQSNGYINGKSRVVKMPILDGREWNERPIGKPPRTTP